VNERLYSARDAEKVLGIPASTIRTWYQRRAKTNLWHYAADRRGRPMFKGRHLIALRDGCRRIPDELDDD